MPESNKLYKGRMTAVGNMLGFIIGIFATSIQKTNLQKVAKTPKLYLQKVAVNID